MPTYTGTYTISDLLAVDDVAIAEFGEDQANAILQRDLARLNAEVDEMLSVYADTVTRTQDRISRFGGNFSADMAPADELGRPVTKKVSEGANLGFPLEKFTYAVGWTRDYMLQSTPADWARQVTAAQNAYLNRIRKELQRSIFLSSNYTYADRFVDDYSLPVKRLLNGDGVAIPNGPNGETFDGGTHDHYVANNGWDNAALKTAVSNLTEHGHVQGVRIFIDSSDETQVKALTDFKELPDPRLTYRATDQPTRTIDLMNVKDRMIGYFDVAEVWVKPWMIADYAFITALGARKPLRRRLHNVASVRGLRVAADLESYPLRAEVMEAYFGFGVQERSNGVMFYAGAGTYTDPTINP